MQPKTPDTPKKKIAIVGVDKVPSTVALMALIESDALDKPDAIAWKKQLGQDIQGIESHLALRNGLKGIGRRETQAQLSRAIKAKGALERKKSQRALLAQWLRDQAVTVSGSSSSNRMTSLSPGKAASIASKVETLDCV